MPSKSYGKEEEKVNKTYTATVQEDAEGNAFVELPAELLIQLGWNEGWREGDELVGDEMEVDDDGKFKRAVIYKNKVKKSKNAI